MKALLLLLSVLSLLALAAATEPTCKLSGLTLWNKKTGSYLTLRDENWNYGFHANTYTYYCTCDATIDQITVTVRSNDEDLSYDMRFRSANGQTDQEFLLPDAHSKVLKFTTGTNRIDILPSCDVCSAQYTIFCEKQPPSGGQVVGDPQFLGLLGQDYQVHGVSGEVYNIISDEHLQMNSKFVFLNSGSCPIINGQRAHGCWSHPGSYLGAIGFKTAGGDRVKLVSGDYRKGFATVELNGKPMKLGQVSSLPCPDGDNTGFVSFNSSYLVTIQAGNYRLELENSDFFINQAVATIDFDSIRSHGLLGQTWRAKTYNTPIKHIEGRVDDYAVKGKDLFGDDFVFNQFKEKKAYQPDVQVSIMDEAQELVATIEDTAESVINAVESALPEEVAVPAISMQDAKSIANMIHRRRHGAKAGRKLKH